MPQFAVVGVPTPNAVVGKQLDSRHLVRYHFHSAMLCYLQGTEKDMSNVEPCVVREARSDECEAVVSVLREAAAWLADKGEPLWQEDELAHSDIAADVEAGLYRLAEVDGEVAGVMRLQTDDPLFWPEDSGDEALYLHRLAVRRRYAGGAVSNALLRRAVREAKALGRKYVRLDTVADRPKLRAVYERFGFILHSYRQVGPYYVARYQFQVS